MQIVQQHPEPSRAAALRRVVEAVQAAAAALEAAGAALVLLAEEPAAPAALTPDDSILTVKEAAAAIRCSPSFVREKCRLGAIKALRLGHGFRIRRSALAAFERRRTAA